MLAIPGLPGRTLWRVSEGFSMSKRNFTILLSLTVLHLQRPETEVYFDFRYPVLYGRFGFSLPPLVKSPSPLLRPEAKPSQRLVFEFRQPNALARAFTNISNTPLTAFLILIHSFSILIHSFSIIISHRIYCPRVSGLP